MILRLTESQMLERWRLLALLEPMRSEGDASRDDLLDLDALCLMRMRAWYSWLLDTAPVEMLKNSDISQHLTLRGDSLILSSRVRRVLTVRMTGWSHSAAPLRDEEARKAMAMLHNPFVETGPDSPCAVVCGNEVRLLTPPEPGATVAEATGIIEPEPGWYELDEQAFSLINEESV